MKYRVWTVNASKQKPYSVMTEWMPRKQCEEYILAKWGHWPPFAHISSAKNSETFARYNDRR